MDLYFSPLACSMASRIVIYEAGGEANFQRVDTKAGRTADGADYSKINPKGVVPALRTDDGEVLTENAAILQYLGDRFPDAGLAPAASTAALLQQWLSFIGTELHTGVFHALLSRAAGPDAKAFCATRGGGHPPELPRRPPGGPRLAARPVHRGRRLSDGGAELGAVREPGPGALRQHHRLHGARAGPAQHRARPGRGDGAPPGRVAPRIAG